MAQVAASVTPDSLPDSAAVVTRNAVTLVGESYPNVVDSKTPNDGRSLGEAHDDPYVSVIPIMRGIVIGMDRIEF